MSGLCKVRPLPSHMVQQQASDSHSSTERRGGVHYRTGTVRFFVELEWQRLAMEIRVFRWRGTNLNALPGCSISHGVEAGLSRCAGAEQIARRILLEDGRDNLNAGVPRIRDPLK